MMGKRNFSDYKAHWLGIAYIGVEKLVWIVDPVIHAVSQQ